MIIKLKLKVQNLTFRKTSSMYRRIKDDVLAEDLDRFNVDQGCGNVDILIEQYDKYLSDLLDRHAP